MALQPLGSGQQKFVTYICTAFIPLNRKYIKGKYPNILKTEVFPSILDLDVRPIYHVEPFLKPRILFLSLKEHKAILK